jgi:hypothetical protein
MKSVNICMHIVIAILYEVDEENFYFQHFKIAEIYSKYQQSDEGFHTDGAVDFHTNVNTFMHDL